MLIQMGDQTVHRRFAPGIPQSFREKRAVKVIAELSRAEFIATDRQANWNHFRSSDLAHIKDFLKSCLPDDSIIELPKTVKWQYWDTQWEAAQCDVIVTTKGYETLSRQSIKRNLFVMLFLGDGPGETQDQELDELWTVLWTGEALPRAIAKLPSIHIDPL